MNSSSEKGSGRADISLSTLWSAFKKFMIVIIISAVVVGALGVIYAKVTKPKYSATVEFTVINVLDDNPYVADSMLVASSSIAMQCVEIINKNVMLSEVVDKHNIDEWFNVSSEEAVAKISGMITAEAYGEGSSIFMVNVTSLDKDTTLKVISSIQDVMPSVVENLYKLSEESSNTTTIKPVQTVDSLDDVAMITSSPIKFGILGALVGLIIAYIVCFLLYVRDTKVYDETSIKSKFDIPVIGRIPDWVTPGSESAATRGNRKKKLASDVRDYEGKLLSATTPFGVSEAFNTLRTNICYSTASDECAVYAVTSDFSGAGKSVVSANVAMSLAMLGKKTLLIDCDLRRPELATIFSKEKTAGLSDYLAGEIEKFESVFTSVDQPNLDVVFSGKIPPNPSDLLGSARMSEFIEKCKGTYDIIIIDTPPACEVSDVGVISDSLTGCILVARSNYSDLTALKFANELIEGVNSRVIGIVINDVDYKAAGYYGNKGRYGKYRKYTAYSYYTSNTASKDN